MAKTTEKKPTKRLYFMTHELILGGMDSNCYMTVIGEFAGGHEGTKEFKGKRLTNAEWFAVLKQSSINIPGLYFFGGVNKTLEKEYPFGQEAFRKFLERNGVKVTKLQSEAHTAYTAYFSKEFVKKIREARAEDHYMDDPVDAEWN